MLKVDQYDYIRTAYRVYGKTIRQIARDTGHSRNTIKKALHSQFIGYRPRDSQPYPVLGLYLHIIDRWLKSDKESPRKQRHTARRVYHRLQYEHGYQGSEGTIRHYVREAKIRLGLQTDNVFIPSDPELGREAEADWGNCQAILSDEPTKLKMFCMRSKGSGIHFVQCYPCERQQALFEGHIQAFVFFDGIFPTLIYDNLTTAVEKVLRGKERRLQEGFAKFKAYYSFTPRFCNVAKGNEKGGVEGLVGYARRNYMVPVPKADSLEELNGRLLEQCLAFGQHRIASRSETVSELFEQEKKHLIALPPVPYENVVTSSGKVDKYSTVIIDKNRYSVPTTYAGLRVQALLYIDRVEIFHNSKKIAAHSRVYGNNKWQLDPQHYLELIYRRPQAFESARVIRQWRPQWPDCLEALLSLFIAKLGHTKGIKEFIAVLMLFKDHESSEVIDAVKSALAANISSSAAVEHLLLKDSATPTPALSSWQRLSPPDVSVYGQIGGEI
ncbi:MAG: IS21 family transposase [Deltaproteobacteria bacterium]|nr:IS21 family transposase [Deltaproteobacteria bacterium]